MPLPSRPPRRLVLVGAFIAACLVAGHWPTAPRADGAGDALLLAGPAPLIALAIAADAPPKAPEPTPSAAAPKPEAATPPAPAPAAEAPKAPVERGLSAEIEIGDKGVIVRKQARGARAGSHDDSFDAFVDKAPWLPGLVFLTVILAFMIPLLVIILVIWYKMRRTRMMNETMVKLAERGVVPPAEAMQALGAGTSVPPLPPTPPNAPLYEQAKALRKQAAWSDLRKGIVMSAVGLGFTFYSIFDDGSPNWIGLVLLFLGAGYVVLWYFEERQLAVRIPPPPPPPGGAA